MADAGFYNDTPYVETNALLSALGWDAEATRKILTEATATELRELADAAYRLAELAEMMAEEKRHAR